MTDVLLNDASISSNHNGYDNAAYIQCKSKIIMHMCLKCLIQNIDRYLIQGSYVVCVIFFNYRVNVLNLTIVHVVITRATTMLKVQLSHTNAVKCKSNYE